MKRTHLLERKSRLKHSAFCWERTMRGPDPVWIFVHGKEGGWYEMKATDTRDDVARELRSIRASFAPDQPPRKNPAMIVRLDDRRKAA